MRYLIYFLVSAVLISLQTTIIPALPLLLTPYDILIPFVVYLTLFRPLSEGLPVIVLTGCAMDMLSGAVAGIYLIIFIWILLLFKRAKIYFHLKDPVLFKMIVIISILIENFIFGLYLSLKAVSFDLSLYACQILLIQLVWAIITSPFFYLIFNYGFFAMDSLIAGGLRKRL